MYAFKVISGKHYRKKVIDGKIVTIVYKPGDIWEVDSLSEIDEITRTKLQPVQNEQRKTYRSSNDKPSDTSSVENDKTSDTSSVENDKPSDVAKKERESTRGLKRSDAKA